MSKIGLAKTARNLGTNTSRYSGFVYQSVLCINFGYKSSSVQPSLTFSLYIFSFFNLGEGSLGCGQGYGVLSFLAGGEFRKMSKIVISLHR